MKVRVIKEFPYAPDGYGVVVVRPGPDLVEIKDVVVPGLVAEGFIQVDEQVPGGTAPAKVEAEVLKDIEEKIIEGYLKNITEPTREVVAEVLDVAGFQPVETAATEAALTPPEIKIEIPADWKSMKWFALKALAESISGADVKTSQEARIVIEGELQKRAG